ncbi:hypothetical protein A2363_00460 [Candidatus Gottesmanbacteria bacterium RIFOXYB1_FULL_47_11]|uniref:Uncharacterized protein n=1 Tax=Candidatus Gottesmanbacteria bacterium RIFOXYB1_FULL_47_11 TaxID=1798401 RepID=A0A1F6BD76_9BACT|nr:MAG: hypothetical protein A2363_00460 [Candidatus Gottesmanbacteria bacterium RIFOXYB1_FULL_47_11]
MARKMQKPIPWLPIDSRLFGPIFSFGHVHGFARAFLVIEIVLATLIVLGSMIFASMKVFGRI